MFRWEMCDPRSLMDTAREELGRKGTQPPAPWAGNVQAQQV